MPAAKTPPKRRPAKRKVPVRTVPVQRKVVQVNRHLPAKYDAAQIGFDNTRHWANADALDAVTANSSGVRTKLRQRSRYEVANNSYARGIVNTLANDVIGTGPRLQMRTGNRDLDRRIEKEFATWSKMIGLAAKLRTMRKARVQDGEAFAIMFSNNSLWPLPTLDIHLVEADQIESPTIAAAGKYTDGIRFDANGTPVGYAVLKKHPGGGYSDVTKYGEIAAEYILHWFRTDRPGQIRGVPEITSALPLFAQLRRYTLAVITSAETAAEWTLFLKTNAPPDSGATQLEDGEFAAIEIERNMMTALPEGWDPFQLKPEQPTTTYGMFKAEILNEIARCLGMPYNVAAGNSSGYNYASGRLDKQTYFRNIAIDQASCDVEVLDRIFAAWMAEAAFMLEIDAAVASDHQWFWKGHEHVDPVKEAKAQAQRLANNTTTLAREMADQGLDWEEELEQRALEVAAEKRLGLTSAAAPAPAPADDGEDGDDDVDEDDEDEDKGAEK